MKKDILQIKESALLEDVPIMQDEGLEFLLEFIRKNKIKNILEVGTAVGYSAIRMANIDKDIKVVTIERDNTRYMKALTNVHNQNLDDRITLIFGDAIDIELNDEMKFDLIFIDAAKGKNIEFFQKFKKYLNPSGYIITDNIKFHGYVDTPLEKISSRNIRGLVRKIRNYIEFLNSNLEYETKFYDVGDGVSVSKRKENYERNKRKNVV